MADKKTNRIGFGSFGARILLCLSLVALGPLVIMAYQGYHCAREALVDSQSSHLASVLESRRTRLESLLENLQANFTSLATIPCVQGGCSRGIVLDRSKLSLPQSCLIDNLEKHFCSLESIASYDQKWHCVTCPCCKDTLPTVPEDFKNKLANSQEVIMASQQDPQTNELFLLIGQPLKESLCGKYQVMRLALTGFINKVLALRTGLGKTGVAFVVSRQGNYLTLAGSTENRLGSPANLPEALLRVGNDQPTSEVTEYQDAQGRKVIGASAALPQLDWVLVTQIDRDEAFAWLSILRNRALITGALTLALVLFLSFKISSRLSRPLQELATVAGRIARGQHQERLDALEGKETQEVGKAFNQMLDELAASHERLRHAAALAVVGELSTSIVHEMRNPLSSVKMNLRALARKVVDDEAHSELAQIAMEQAERLEIMLDDLLGYGKPLTLKPAPILFSRLASDAEEVVRNASEAKGLAIEVGNSLNGHTLYGDHEQIWRALTNLLTNAIDQADSDGGRITLSAYTPESRPGFAALSVSDNGPGVDDALKESIFQPFYTTRENGIGIGLANVRKIAEYHGGSVEVTDRRGGGAIFTLYLPLKGPSA